MIKICGITRLEDAQLAVAHGATALGFVFWSKSPRAVSAAVAAAIVRALPADVARIGVFVNEGVAAIRQVIAESGLTAVQMHGDETPADAASLPVPVVRAVTIGDAAARDAAWPRDTIFLLDAADPVRRGGTGRRVDWEKAAGVCRGRRVILAGGLTPENVATAIATVHPYGVDVSSGVEATPGIKDAAKVQAFLANARTAFARLESKPGPSGPRDGDDSSPAHADPNLSETGARKR